MNYGEYRASDQNVEHYRPRLEQSPPAFWGTLAVFCFGLAGLLALVAAAVLAFGR